jgi:riboflavin biosynthesis pyrimidine reductase
MIEGGAEVLESFVRARTIDYIVLTVSPLKLSNPCAVRLGHCTSAVLENWRASNEHLQLGADRLEIGPLAHDAREPSWAGVRLTAQ